MTFHKINLGSFGSGVRADIDGYVPTEDTGPWDLNYEHSERTHDDAGELTEYGEWWESEGFPAVREDAVRAAAEAEVRLADWQ